MKRSWKPGTMLYPLPAAMVTCGKYDGESTKGINIITISWTGTICSEPPMLSISVRPIRYSHPMICETKEFVVNLSTKGLAYATDYAGVKSGKDIDKFKELKLTPVKAFHVSAPLIKESPVNIECRVRDVIKLGSHDMFIADVAGVAVDEEFIDKNGNFDLQKTDPLAYSHGQYYLLGKHIGRFGFSVKKK